MSSRRFASSRSSGSARALIFVALAFLCQGVAGFGEETPSTPPSTLADTVAREVRGVIEKTKAAICRVEGTDEHGTLRGTGFLIDADGTLLTSYSVGGQSEDLVVTLGEEKFPATRRAADPRSGLAVLHIDAAEPLPFLKCGSSVGLDVGAPVVSLGFPLDLPLSPSFGLIAGRELKFQNRYFATRHLRLNVVVQRGQGGSPILNLNGELVGVLISTIENGSGAFALPVEAAKKLLHDLEQHGRVRQGWLGADVRRTEAREFGSSARVRNVRSDGPGHRGGLRPGDVLLQVGDRRILSPEDVLDASFYITAEEPLKVKIARAGKQQELTVIPQDPPNGEGPIAEQDAAQALGATGMGFGSGR
jgi:serine protease Do